MCDVRGARFLKRFPLSSSGQHADCAHVEGFSCEYISRVVTDEYSFCRCDGDLCQYSLHMRRMGLDEVGIIARDDGIYICLDFWKDSGEGLQAVPRGHSELQTTLAQSNEDLVRVGVGALPLDAATSRSPRRSNAARRNAASLSCATFSTS